MAWLCFNSSCLHNRPRLVPITQKLLRETQDHPPRLAFLRRGWEKSLCFGLRSWDVNSAIGYLLILAVMSFNGGVVVAILMELGIGDTTVSKIEPRYHSTSAIPYAI